MVLLKRLHPDISGVALKTKILRQILTSCIPKLGKVSSGPVTLDLFDAVVEHVRVDVGIATIRAVPGFVCAKRTLKSELGNVV